MDRDFFHRTDGISIYVHLCGLCNDHVSITTCPLPTLVLEAKTWMERDVLLSCQQCTAQWTLSGAQTPAAQSDAAALGDECTGVGCYATHACMGMCWTRMAADKYTDMISYSIFTGCQAHVPIAL